MDIQQMLTFGSGPWWLNGITYSIFTLCWVGLYIMAIRRGFKDKVMTIPFVALAINMAWDITGFTIAQGGPEVQALTDGFYYLMQLPLLYLVVKYGWKDFPRMSKNGFLFWVALSQVAALIFMIIAMVELRDPVGVKTAYIDTFINAILFIAMFYRREGLEGQSIYIGLAKLIGTAQLNLALFFYPFPGYPNWPLIAPLYIGIFLLDLIYVILVYRRAQEMGINVWKRW